MPTPGGGKWQNDGTWGNDFIKWMNTPNYFGRRSPEVGLSPIHAAQKVGGDISSPTGVGSPLHLSVPILTLILPEK